MKAVDFYLFLFDKYFSEESNSVNFQYMLTDINADVLAAILKFKRIDKKYIFTIVDTVFEEDLVTIDFDFLSKLVTFTKIEPETDRKNVEQKFKLLLPKGWKCAIIN